jgi:hypothetical protein
MSTTHRQSAVQVLELTREAVLERLVAISGMPDPSVARSRFLQLMHTIDAAEGLALDRDAQGALQRTRDRLRI